MKHNPILDFTVDPADITFVGKGLHRPECVLCTPDGTLWISDARSGVTRITGDGRQHFIEQRIGGMPVAGGCPNGLALAANGSLLAADFGTRALHRIATDGRTEIVLDTIDGIPLGQVNFVLTDAESRIWITVSTRRSPFVDAFRPEVSDGYIALIDERGPRIVADGLSFPNEIRFDAAEEWLYVAETTGRRIRRFAVAADVSLAAPEIFGPGWLGPGFPDGIAFDEFGNLWVAMVMGERIVGITPAGDTVDILDDRQCRALDAVEAAFETGSLTGELMAAAKGSIAPLTTSIAFGGPDRRDVHIGSLMGDRIAKFRSPVAGLPMAHWRS